MLLTLNAENPSRALAYVRVSSQRQVDEGVSIEAQIKRIKEYARYKGLTLEDKDILKSIHLMEHCVFEGDLTQHPMVFEDCDNLSLYYSFWMAEGLSELQRNAFDRFTKSVMETIPKKFKLPQNWCLVINNRRIFHGRTALSDNSNRFLKRYWISSSKHKKLE